MDVNIIRKLFVGPFQKGEDENIIRRYRIIDLLAQSGLLLFLIYNPLINKSFKIFGLLCFTIVVVNILTRYVHIVSFILNFLICSYWIKISEIFQTFDFQTIIILLLCITLMTIPLLHFIYDFIHAKKTIANDSLVIMACLIIDGFFYGLDDLVINAKLENQLDKLILSLGEMICIFSLVLITCTFLWCSHKVYCKYVKKTIKIESKPAEIK
ncbi:MAG: hypothetical protein ACRCXN_07025 [Bacteroidales bacterium]